MSPCRCAACASSQMSPYSVVILHKPYTTAPMSLLFRSEIERSICFPDLRSHLPLKCLSYLPLIWQAHICAWHTVVPPSIVKHSNYVFYYINYVISCVATLLWELFYIHALMIIHASIHTYIHTSNEWDSFKLRRINPPILHSKYIRMRAKIYSKYSFLCSNEDSKSDL